MAERTIREAASAPLIAAANFVKRRSRAVLARGEAGIGSVAAQRNCLREWFEGRGQILTPGYCRQIHHFGGGAEHEVFFDVKNTLAIKATHPNRFGWCVSSEAFPHATPWEYLRRLIYHNWFLGDNIQLVGAIAGEDHIEIITSQPWIYGDPQKPPATDEQIVSFFASRGFCKSSTFSGGGFFYSPSSNVIAADAHSSNVLVSVEGDIMPIDIVMGKPGTVLEARLRREFKPMSSDIFSISAGTSNTTATTFLED